MKTLRLTQIPIGEGRYHVEVALEGDGLPRMTADGGFDFSLSPQQAEDLRWYLEDYLQHPHDPAPKIAARVEALIKELGVTLFRAVFQSSDDARDLWATLRLGLSDTRVEVVTGVNEAAAVPWELLRDPTTDTPLALRARSFVRAHPQPAQRPGLPSADSASMRILLVICRPGGDDDVPFRSVAMRILKGLSVSASDVFQLDVLRPPTFEQLGEALRRAVSEGRPYHIVHFDGHGMFLDLGQLFEEQASGGPEEENELPDALADFDPRRYSPRNVYPRQPREGRRGYLAFENPQGPHNLRLIDGPELGALLAETGVPVLVMNACRSAYPESPASPEKADENRDPHAKVRAFGSLAQEVMDAGVAGVVAMRYNVYVVTAAQFVADLYAALAEGQPFGEAATLGRKKLNDQPQREVAYGPLPLQDWVVPVAYEAAPLALIRRRGPGQAFSISVDAGQSVAARGSLDPQLPRRPDAGFFGRDGTLLKLDRLFDTQNVVLLHAYAGGGKTATVAEFARWYSLTDGVRGPVLYTSFEHHRSLARVLDQLGQVFNEPLERAGVNWLALEDAERRAVALEVLGKIPVLWVWDNVEPVAGFPAAARSAWSAEEQSELADFLRDARETQAKFLLTSRRDERGWLGDLPARVELPPMPMQERVQFARALAERHGRRITDIEAWRSLLRFTRGNPLAITVLIGQALRDNLTTREQIEAFVARLRAGESAFEDEASEGRTKSLGASLSYGFKHAFTEDEGRLLALLHLFQGCVNVAVLLQMSDPSEPDRLPELAGATEERWASLLGRAAEIGLIDAVADGFYYIHPALPWFFRVLFEQYYGAAGVPGADGLRATRAYAEAIAGLSYYLYETYEKGRRESIPLLEIEEQNLLHARSLAITHGWWDTVVRIMRGLHTLYEHSGRWGALKRVVDDIYPLLIDPATDRPLPGHEEHWRLIIEHRSRIAFEERRWDVAERLQRALVDDSRERCYAALAALEGRPTREEFHTIRSYVVSLHEFGMIQSQLGQPECVETFLEVLKLCRQIGEERMEAGTLLNLGVAYLTLPGRIDLQKAEEVLKRGLSLVPENDHFGRSKYLSELGFIAIERFKQAQASRASGETMVEMLNEGYHLYQEALDLTPPNALSSLSVKNSALCNIYRYAGDSKNALRHGLESIRLEEEQGNTFNAAMGRYNVAIVLAEAGRADDAREYANAALRALGPYANHAAELIGQVRGLISQLDQSQKG